MSQRAEVIVRGLIVNGADEVLLVRHRSRDWWFLPGGHLERGESLGECLQRELLEEAQLSIAPGRLIAVVEHRYEEKGEKRVEVNLLLAARTLGEIGAVEEKLEFGWFPLGVIDVLDARPPTLMAFVVSNSEHVGVALDHLPIGSLQGDSN